jgi:hypothetical protein
MKNKIVIGSKYNMLTVLEKSSKYGKFNRVKCICDCLNVYYANITHLRSGRIYSCGCTRRPLYKSKRYKEGTPHGGMIIIEDTCTLNNNKSKERILKLKCTFCSKEIYGTSHVKIKSCGCLNQEKLLSIIDREYNSFVPHGIYRNLEVSLTKEEFGFLIFQNCHYCGAPPSYKTIKGNKLKQGIDRVFNNLGYFYLNCVPCCFDCNKHKGVSSYFEFLGRVKRILALHDYI